MSAKAISIHNTIEINGLLSMSFTIGATISIICNVYRLTKIESTKIYFFYLDILSIQRLLQNFLNKLQKTHKLC